MSSTIYCRVREYLFGGREITRYGEEALALRDFVLHGGDPFEVLAIEEALGIVHPEVP